jgi:hypothetical protein
VRRNIDLNGLEGKQILKIMMAETNVESFAEVAKMIDIPQTTLRSALTNNSIRLSLFLKLADSMGYNIVAQPKE